MRALHRRVRVLWLVAVTLAAWAAHAQPLGVSAASSLGDALRDMAPLFEAAHPGVTLRLNFAASGALLQQIEQGATADVLISADEDTVARGILRKALVADSRRVVAANTLVLIRPPHGASVLETLPDLQRPEVRRIAVGRPASVPAGRYTQQALVAARLWESLRAKIAPADDVRQVLDLVARGEVDAGFVYATDAASVAAQVQIVLTATGHLPIRYPAAVVASSRNPALAREFIAFLATPPAQAALLQRGFLAP